MAHHLRWLILDHSTSDERGDDRAQTGDCQQRIEGRDPGVPCPRHLNLAANQARTAAFKLASIDSYKVDMLGYVEQSGRPREFWHNEIHNLTSVEP